MSAARFVVLGAALAVLVLTMFLVLAALPAGA